MDKTTSALTSLEAADSTGPAKRRGTVDAAANGGCSSRVARRRDRRKAEIIRTATKLLSSAGYQGMSLEEVAEQTDIAKATLYHYFASKDELVAAALKYLAQEVLRRLAGRQEAEEGASPRELLRALVCEQILILKTSPEVATVFSWPRGWPEAFEEPLKDIRRRHDAVFRRVVEHGVSEGEFTCDDIDVAMQCLHGILNQSPVWIRPGVRVHDREDVLNATVDCALRLFA
ncbi:TetR/AcrR family transcriptional regulator [Nocardia xishanensis]|uniref:TetR/AcrR family transcriptional regulator n=1 Tax=Nocardia xishanensis TaxID=238964 RepID=A0ABW7XCG9_9NOCA